MKYYYPPPKTRLELLADALTNKIAAIEDKLADVLAGTITMSIVSIVLVAAIVAIGILISGYAP